MNIAIIGAGFSGLALAWHLLHHKNTNSKITVTLFDKKGVGAGASGIAAGLLHAYAGPDAKQSWNADCALQETFFLLEEASSALGKKCYVRKGILRPAITEQQKKNFFASSERYADTEWWDQEQCAKHSIPNASWQGLFIPQGACVFCGMYLEGLYSSCKTQGLTLRIEDISSFTDLEKDFDSIIFAGGSGAIQFKELQQYSLQLTRGQLLVLQNTLPYPLHVPLIAEKYLTFSESQDTLIAGATFERNWANKPLSAHDAEYEIRKKIEGYSHEIGKLPLQEVRSGFRMWRNGYKPFILKIDQQKYAIGGLGSKGLLYHAWLAKLLANALISQEHDLNIPKELMLEPR